MTNNIEQTFFILKPDALEKGVHFKVLERAENNGLYIKNLKRVVAKKQLLEAHYSHLVDKPFFSEIISYMTRRPVFVGILEGENAIQKWRTLLGDTNPQKAAKGTIRHDFGDHNSFENIAHGSDSIESAKKEISIWYSL